MSIVNDKFKNRYRMGTSRLQDWDYASAGYYYVTICTYNRTNYFGEIGNGNMHLSRIGEIAQQCWSEIPKHYPMVKLDEFIVMPNHVHGIINIVETQNFASLQNDDTKSSKTHELTFKNTFGPQSKNLGSIIRGYKAGVKKWTTINNVVFRWQPRYYDHIIRDEESLTRIREYIKNNPLQWANDIENKDSVKTQNRNIQTQDFAPLQNIKQKR